MKQFVKDYLEENKIRRYKCKRCKARFESQDELIKHRIYQHGEYPKDTHVKHEPKDTRVHDIYMKYYGNHSKKEPSEPFNPEEVYALWKEHSKPSQVYHNVNNPEIPEEERIYSPNRKYWCKRTSKKEAEAFMKSLSEMHERMKTRGTQYVEPDIQDWVSNGKMNCIRIGTKIPLNQTIDVLYIWDKNRHEYRIYTDGTKYGEWQEIVYDNNSPVLLPSGKTDNCGNQCYILKGVNRNVDVKECKEVMIFEV